MTVTNLTVKQTFNGDGSTTQFNIPFEFIEGKAAEQLKVYLIDANGDETLQVESTDWNFTPPVTTPSSIDMNTPPAADETLRLERVLALQQVFDLSVGQFKPETYEDALDSLLMMIQQIGWVADRALTIAEGSGSGEIPPFEANSFLVANSTADGFEWLDFNQVSVIGPGASNDNAIARWDSTSGNLLLDSTVYLADDGSLRLKSNSAPDTSAILDLTATDKGFLPPAMTTAQRDAISTPATGLMVYNTTTSKLNQYDGTAWVVVGDGDVVGPGSATDENIAVYDGVTGKLIKDGGQTIAEILDTAGNVDGPASATDANIATYDGVTGKIIQDGGQTIAQVVSDAVSQSGDVDGPASSNDNAISRFDSTTGKIIQDSTSHLDDSGNLRLGSNSAPDASAILDLSSTTKGLLPPVMTTAQRDAIGSPTEGLEIYNSTDGEFQFYNGSTWQSLGSAAPDPKQFITGDNRNFEAGLGDWVTYKDAAGVEPVDGTGGSSGLTLSTAGPALVGSQNATIAHGVTNKQGEGVSLSNIAIPELYRGRPLKFRLGHKQTAGTFALGDVIIYAYDETNSELLGPVFDGNNGQLDLKFNEAGIFEGIVYPNNDTASIRMIIHMASTTTSGFNFNIDEVQLFWEPLIKLPSSGITKAYTPTTQGLGSVTWSYSKFTILGDRLFLQLKGVLGTTSASEAQISLPNGFKASSDYSATDVGSVQTNAGNDTQFIALASSGDSFINMGFRSPTSGTIYTPANGNALFSSSVTISVNAIVKVDQLSANTTEALAINSGLQFEEKILSADVTTDTTMGDLTISNLIVGRRYMITGQIAYEIQSGDNNIQVIATHDSSTIAEINSGNSGGGSTTFPIVAVSFVFEATASSITFASNGVDASSVIAGNNTKAETYIQAHEIPFSQTALVSSNPTGSVQMFAGTTAPFGFLMCDGSEVSRSTYSSLFDVIGTAYGNGDGSTTFTLPDMRGRFARGVDDGEGNDPDASSRSESNPGGNTGDSVGSLQGDEFKSHGHNVTAWHRPASHFHEDSDTIATRPTIAAGSRTFQAAQSAGGSETRPKNVNFNYIIKT